MRHRRFQIIALAKSFLGENPAYRPSLPTHRIRFGAQSVATALGTEAHTIGLKCIFRLAASSTPVSSRLDPFTKSPIT